MQIIVPLDGSSLAERAIEPAALLARRSPTPVTLTLLRVDDHQQIVEAVAEEFSPAVAASIPDRADEYLSYLQGVHAAFALDDLEVKIAVVPGAPVAAIEAFAHATQTELIVMASHVLTTLDRVMWGSVTESVARDVGIPTLIIRPNGVPFASVTQANPFTILVPLDGTQFAETAIDAAAFLARSFSGTLLLLHVLPEIVGMPEELAEREVDARIYLTAISHRLTAQGIKTDRLVTVGDPAIHIANAIQDGRADMVAIATHGQENTAHFTHASIMEEVLHHVPAPMLVVHPLKTYSTLLATVR